MSRWFKLKRELHRVGQQLKGIPESCYEPVLQRRHDKYMRTSAQLIGGNINEGPRVLLLLIYQPDAVNESVFHLLQNFCDLGFAPLVVSNTPLSSADSTRIQEVSWKVLLRRNFGYDFGGYRDGILHLIHNKIAFDELVVMNDSVWCSVVSNFDFIEQARARNADVVGGVLRTRGQQQFLESYFYFIKRSAFDNAEFVAYWENYRLTSNKYWVIRRGERGFSAMLGQSSLVLGALYTNERFTDLLSRQSAVFLQHTLRYASYRNAEHKVAGKQLLAAFQNNSGWRQSVVAHVAAVLQRDVLNSAFCYAAVHLFDFPFLKKSADPVNVRWRQQYTNAVADGYLPAPPPVTKQELPMPEIGDDKR